MGRSPGFLAAWLVVGGLCAQDGGRGALASLERDLLMRAPALGLGEQAGLRLVSHAVDGEGTVHGRFQLTHRGVPVWGAYLLGHLHPDRGLRAPHLALPQPITSVPPAQLDERAAVALVLQDLALPPGSRELAPVHTESVVFPSAATGGLTYDPGPQPGLYAMNPRFSVMEEPPAEAFVPALVVHTRHQVPGVGILARATVVDLSSGRLLRKDPGVHFAGPTTATGLSQYSGSVVLNAYRLGDGRLELRDTTRPTQAHALQDAILGVGQAPANFVYVKANGSALPQATPIRTASDTFGDGQSFDYLNPWQADLFLGPNGQTAAVDAAFGIQVTWDLLAKVLGRSGPDGQGSAIAADVHANLSFRQPYANAYWDSVARTISFGDGGGTTLPLTSVDVVAHELGHAVMSSTANLTYSGESGGLNEANSDMFAMAAMVYALRGEGLEVPNGFTWDLGAQFDVNGSAIRNLKRPSAKYLPDGWYDGIEVLPVHYAGGPGGRFFYYLCQGCDPTDADARSSYLSKAFPGIGMRKALTLWYRTLTAHVADPGSGYHALRTATLAAATELYGAASTELAAVANAWAAVGVGPAAGATVAPELRLEPGPWPGGLTGSGLISSRSRELFVNLGGAVPLPKALATGFSATPTLTWGCPFALVDSQTGILRTSVWNMIGWNFSFSVSADGTPYKATGMVNPVVMDLDGDGTVDAADAATLAIYAMSGKLPSEPWDPAILKSYLPPAAMIYRWNRAFEALRATGRN